MGFALGFPLASVNEPPDANGLPLHVTNSLTDERVAAPRPEADAFPYPRVEEWMP
jgi:hypothetical protein